MSTNQRYLIIVTITIKNNTLVQNSQTEVMSIEIERKFLVKSTDFKTEMFQKSHIKQGFLNTDKERTVRVRIVDDTGFLTVKGISNKQGTTRFEWEKEIALEDARSLLLLAEKGIIEKHRYFVKVKNHTYEVDVFLEDNKGLVIAEIELDFENEPFEKPHWLGKEVTGNKAYYNSSLSKNPFKSWERP